MPSDYNIPQLRSEAEALIEASPDGLEGDDAVRFDEIARVIQVQIKRDEIRAAVESGRAVIEHTDPEPIKNRVDNFRDPFDGGSRFENETQTRQRAAAAIERTFADADSASSATDVLNRVEGSAIADHLIVYSNPAYRSAFAKHIRNPETGYQTFTDSERKAWGLGQEYQRAALELAGAVLPSPLDPSIVLTNAGTLDPMRNVARIEQTVSSNRRFVTSAGVTAAFTVESTEVGDGTPTLSEVDIPTFKAHSFAMASIEAASDQPDFDREVAMLFSDAKAVLEGTKWVSGNGTSEPEGIWTKLDGSGSEIAPTGAEAFIAADVYKLSAALPARWAANSKFMAEGSTLNHIDQFETTAGAKLFPELGANKLLRRDAIENSNLDAYSDFDAAATSDNALLYLGDFKQFVILDRVGMSVEFIPHLFAAANNLPSGQRGWYAWWRVGSELLSSNAMVVMSVPTAA